MIPLGDKESRDREIRFIKESIKGMQEAQDDARERLVGIAALVIGLVVLMLHIESLRCHKYAELNKVNHDYSVMSGCMVQNKNKAWVPLGQIRGGL